MSNKIYNALVNLGIIICYGGIGYSIQRYMYDPTSGYEQFIFAVLYMIIGIGFLQRTKKEEIVIAEEV
jgi:hypothetical protein